MNHEEKQYIEAIEYIIQNGTSKDDRTGTGTLSITGISMRFNLESFPLLTTKKVNFKAVLEELLFFVRGDTNNQLLVNKNVNIWTANSTSEFFKRNGIQREAGDLGPIYGFQWRHFGATYKSCHDNYSNQGIDQLKNVISEIKTNPNSRRLVVSAWNPLDLDSMALPPCHCIFQFIVREDFLDCCMYQRSGDMGLGVPFNIASYSLLTYMVAHICDLKPGTFFHVIGDAHIYKNHIPALLKQLERDPKPFPKLKILRKVDNIDDFKAEDFVVVGYDPHPYIKMDMAV